MYLLFCVTPPQKNKYNKKGCNGFYPLQPFYLALCIGLFNYQFAGAALAVGNGLQQVNTFGLLAKV